MDNNNRYYYKFTRRRRTIEREGMRMFLPVFQGWARSIPYDLMTEADYKLFVQASVNEDELLDVYNEFYGYVFEKEGTYQLNQLEKEASSTKSYEIPVVGEVSEWLAAAIRFFQEFGGLYIRSVQQTYIEVIVQLIAQGLADGKSMQETAKEVEEYVNKRNFYRWQSERIVRTESGTAMNGATYQAGEFSTLQSEKVWISTRDARTRGRRNRSRFDHYDADGQKVDYEEPFLISNLQYGTKEAVEFPGDPQASAANKINCRCTFRIRAKRDENGDLVFKPGVLD